MIGSSSNASGLPSAARISDSTSAPPPIHLVLTLRSLARLGHPRAPAASPPKSPEPPRRRPGPSSRAAINIAIGTFSMQASSREQERIGGRTVKPLRIVDQAEQRAIRRSFRKQA